MISIGWIAERNLYDCKKKKKASRNHLWIQLVVAFNQNIKSNNW